MQFQTRLVIHVLGVFSKITLKWLPRVLINCLQVNSGSDNGLEPAGNKPLPESMLTQICVANNPACKRIVHRLYKFIDNRS